MSVDEFVVIQYEIDAIKEAEVSKLRHKHKKDKKRAKKSQSKGKNPIIPE